MNTRTIKASACVPSVLAGVLLVIAAALFGAGATQEDPNAAAYSTTATTTEFFAVDVYVDSGDAALGAYQVRIEPAAGAGARLKVVGIEGSDPARGGGAEAFAEPPFYDPAAMMHERVVIAALSTREKSALPTGRVRVARIHFMLEDAGTDEWFDALALLHAELQAAGNERGERIRGAGVTLEAADIERANDNNDRADQAEQTDQGDTP